MGLFGFVRLHHPELTNEHAVFTCGRDYLGRWMDRGWIRIADAPLYPSTIASASDIATFLEQHGVAAHGMLRTHRLSTLARKVSVFMRANDLTNRCRQPLSVPMTSF
jgi:hypothetical protein